MKLTTQTHTILSFALVALLAAAPIYAQTTRHVDGVNGNDEGGANDCTDTNTPCQTISHAIDVSFGGDLIQITDATYTESLDIPRTLTLQGESEEGTIIQAASESGQAQGRTVTVDGDFDVEISDLTFRHGIATGTYPNDSGGGIFIDGATVTLANVSLSDNEAERSGGGIAFFEGSLTLTDVTFTGNETGQFGGGLYTGFQQSPTLNGVTFSNNRSGLLGGGMYNNRESAPELNNVIFNNNRSDDLGGGMFNGESNPVLTNVVFEMNHADNLGGGMLNGGGEPMITDVAFNNNSAGESGGGMYNAESSPTLTDVDFVENTASGTTTAVDGGGGMLSTGISASPTLTNVRFIENSAVRGGGMRINNGDAALRNVHFRDNVASILGGGLYVRESEPMLTNVVFSGNEAQNGGGMVTFFSDIEPTLANVTFNGNSAENAGGGLYSGGGGSPTLINAILWGNTASGSVGGNQVYNGSTSSAELTHSLFGNDDGDIVEGDGFTCSNCLTVDPLFLEPENGNLRLTEGSPAIDAGDPLTNPLVFPTDENGNPIDLLGNPRFFGEAIDMGAYEWNPNVADEARPEEVAEVLGTPYPNPTHNSTTLALAVERTQHVTVEVFDALGRRVQTLHDGALAAGTAETLTLDASALPAGVYIVRATGEDFAATRRVTVIR